MAKKDKFSQLKKDGGNLLSSFNTIAATVAAIDKQGQPEGQSESVTVEQRNDPAPKPQTQPQIRPQEVQKFMRLPNPQIPLQEYNLVSLYISSLPNMTRQDFVELAIIEKLHNDGGMSQEDFNKRYEEIRNRPPRGQRKGTKQAIK